MENKESYQLVCNAYYCGWKSDVTDNVEELDKIESCPRCGVKRGDKFKIVTV